MSSAWVSPEDRAEVVGYLEEVLGIPATVFAEHRFVRRGEYICAVREEAFPACSALRWIAAGLKIVKVTGSGGFRPATRGVQVFGRWATRRVVDLGRQDLRDLLEGRRVPSQGKGGPVILRWNDVPIGVGLVREGHLVSQLPRNLTEHLRFPERG